MEQGKKAKRRRSSLGISLRSLLDGIGSGSSKRRNSCNDDDADLEFPRRRRRSSTIGSDQTRDSFEVMVRRSSHGDDSDHRPDAVRRGSLYRPRNAIDLDSLALSSSSSVVRRRSDVGQKDTKKDDDIPDDDDDDARIQRLIECLRVTQEGSAARRSSADDANATATIFARQTSQQQQHNKKTFAFRHHRRRHRSMSSLS